MSKFLLKFISFVIIFNLLLPRGINFVIPVAAQSQESPTLAPAPPSDASLPKSGNGEKPESTPQPAKTEASPTSSPQPTNEPSPTQESPTPTLTENSQTDSFSTQAATLSEQSSGDSTSSSSVNDPANIVTGPLSDNFAQEINNKVESVVNTNLAQMENKLAALSSTGFNFANLNTLDGQVVTGDALSTLNLLNKLNSNMTGLGGFSVYNIYDNFKGDIVFQLSSLASDFISSTSTVAKNSITGSNSNNIADAQNSFTVNEANGNDAKLVNDLVLEAVSGGNSASFNTGGGSIKTGNATALANVINMVNTNLNVSQWLVGVVNVFGTLTGDIILPQDESGPPVEDNTTILAENSNTGFSSTNNATVDTTDTTNISNTNQVDIETNLEVSSNTGNNTTNINTGGGGIVTGSSDTSVSNTTIANSNTTQEEETVWMVIVNEMGKWVGHIIGAPWESNVASNSLPITYTAQNTGTGPLSNNEASYSEVVSDTMTNNNTADIVNNIKASSDTGSNDASYNTGSGVIETGNAKIGLNLVNMVNTNVVAKKFITVLVNVLGEFLGNIIPSDQNQPQSLAQKNNSSENSGSPELPTPTPTVHNYPSFTVASNDVTNTSEDDTVIAENYTSSVQDVASLKKNTVSQGAKYPGTNDQNGQMLEEVLYPKRGIFISQAFAKATESSFPGMLLGGVNLKVTPSWLSVIPIAVVLVILRRRKKINVERYINYILRAIL